MSSIFFFFWKYYLSSMENKLLFYFVKRNRGSFLKSTILGRLVPSTTCFTCLIKNMRKYIITSKYNSPRVIFLFLWVPHTQPASSSPSNYSSTLAFPLPATPRNLWVDKLSKGKTILSYQCKCNVIKSIKISKPVSYQECLAQITFFKS